MFKEREKFPYTFNKKTAKLGRVVPITISSTEVGVVPQLQKVWGGVIVVVLRVIILSKHVDA
jgi:hypothetical protein